MKDSKSKEYFPFKIPTLPINDQSFSSNSASPQSQTHRTTKFFPLYPKQKNTNELPWKKNHFPRPHKKSFEFIHTPFKKTKQIQDLKQHTQTSSHKLIQQNSAKTNKSEKKILPFLKKNDSFPKLRETNSTQCQSPKAKEILFYSRFSQFNVLRKLGSGRFGDVFLVTHKITGFIAALKIIGKASLLSESQEESKKSIGQLISEIKIQSFLNHPNVVSIYDCFDDENNVYLLMQLATDGNLYSVTEKGHCFTEEAASIVVREVVSGIREMHKKDIIHRDIKLQNIVLSHGMAKICDFGWSVYCPKEFRSTLCGTPLYLSPEMLSGKIYNKKIDIWAIGSITHELITSKDPFKIKHCEDLNKIITQDFQMKDGSPEVRSFVNFILRKNPSKRPDADTVLMHPFIEKYRDLQTSEQLCRIRSIIEKQ